MIILDSDDPLTISPETLQSIKVDMTIMGERSSMKAKDRKTHRSDRELC